MTTIKEHELTHFDLTIYPQYSDSIREICEEWDLVVTRINESLDEIQKVNQKELQLSLEYQSIKKWGVTNGSVAATAHRHALIDQIEECFKQRSRNHQLLEELQIKQLRYRNHLEVILKSIKKDFGSHFSIHIQQKIHTSYPKLNFES